MARQYKNARKSQKLIVKDAAAKLDVSPSTLGAWESERKAPSIESLEAMADLYQVSTDYLLGREETTPTPSLPLPGEVLKIYHGKSVWSSDYGWVLVNSIPVQHTYSQANYTNKVSEKYLLEYNTLTSAQ